MRSGLIVSPMTQKIDLKPGETYRGEIRVSNPAAAEEDLYFKVEMKPYTVHGEEYTSDFKTVSDWSRIVEWTTLEEDSGILKPNEMKKIHFTIEVPENAPGGGQYATFTVMADNSSKGDESAAVAEVHEMASLIYASVEGEITHGGEILDTHVTDFVAVGSPRVTTRIKNSGNVHETAHFAVVVKNNITGEIVYPKEEAKDGFDSVIMPESTRLVTTDLMTLPQLGVFEVTETISYLGQEISMSSIIAVCPIWFLSLIFATIGSIIGMIIFGAYNRRKKHKKVVDF